MGKIKLDETILRAQTIPIFDHRLHHERRYKNPNGALKRLSFIYFDFRANYCISKMHYFVPNFLTYAKLA